MNNIKNCLVTKPIIEGILNKYLGDVVINDLDIYQKAFIHKSFCHFEADSETNVDFIGSNGINTSSDQCCAMILNKSNNERMEFLGDSVVSLVVAEYLFDNFPGKSEGFLTGLKSRLVKFESLSHFADKLGFRKYLLISSHVERISGRQNDKFLEDTFESFVCSIYKDQGYQACKSFITGVIKDYADINDLITNSDNFKDSLLRYFHSVGWGSPVYTNIFTTGGYTKEFTSIVMVNRSLLNVINGKNAHKDYYQKIHASMLNALTAINREFTPDNINNEDIILGIGKGKTKRASEQECSKNCLINLNISLNF